MAREQSKPFSKTEIKILIYNKMKKGMSYEKAKKELARDVKSCVRNHKKVRDAQKKEIAKNKKFKKAFRKLSKKKTLKKGGKK